LQLADAEGDGRWLEAGGGGQLSLGARSRGVELEQHQLVAGVDAERGERRDGQCAVPDPDGADELIAIPVG
jgi:hypothetical protein